MNHSVNGLRSIRFRDILKWWPLLLAAMVVATVTAFWAHENQAPTYTSTTRIVVVPLPQWDETFLGTDLVRDSGDATRTAPTVATDLESDHYAVVAAEYLGGAWTPQSVAADISIAAVGETNTIEIAARSSSPEMAKKLASGFAGAVMGDRWLTISGQLESRIAALAQGTLSKAGDQQGANPAGTEAAGRLQTLTIVRDSRVDPTLRIGSPTPAVRDSEMSLPVTLVLGALGGLFVGALAAAALEFLRRSKSRPAPQPAPAPTMPVRHSNSRVFTERSRG